MPAHDPTHGADPSRDAAPPTLVPSTDPAPSLDSLLTRAPSSYPDTRFEPGISTPFQGTTDTYATSNPDATPSANRDIPPDAFPGYELLEKLGEGGMAIVYKARQTGLNRLVALKMILGGHRAGEKDLLRFLVEAEAVASIKHPHVVQVHEYGEADHRPFLAMEYLPGGTLAERLKRDGKLEPRHAAEPCRQGSGLSRSRSGARPGDRPPRPQARQRPLRRPGRAQGHRLRPRQAGQGQRPDPDPGRDGHPRLHEPRAGLRAAGGGCPSAPQADVYALGVILYECLTGTRPFVHEDTRVLLARVMMDDPEPPSRHVPGLPRDLELIALKCLAKEPGDRYPTAAALTEDLAHFVAGEPVSVRAASTIERALKWARRKPTQAAAYALTFAVVILLAFGASLAVLWRKAEGARGTAETALKGETKAREGEKKARMTAESARDAETKARTIAESARDGEKKARADVEIAREKLARVEYGLDDASGLSRGAGQQ